jgi:aspartate aminotransferase/aromatic-amino-acid transaminase
MSYRPFAVVEMAPPDPILGTVEQFRKETNPKKVNLCIGVYQDHTGANPVLKSVKQAERMWLEQERTKDYLGMAGEESYGRLVQELVFGAAHAAVKEQRAVTLHAPGGTGALRVGGDFIHTQLPKAALWISDPTWPNHRGIFQSAGLKVNSYPYYDPQSHGLDFGRMLEALEKIPEGDVVLLHGCCHNPTGADPTPQQWNELAALFKRRPLVPFLDFAYQGFGDGLEEDAYGVRAFAAEGLEMLLSSSFSKNFGLYRERVGALTFVAGDSQEAARVMSRAKLTVRANYSSPPSHGGKVVEIVLSHPELRALWAQEVNAMRDRIHQMRRLFVQGLKAQGVARNFDFIMAQRGMFSFSGITAEEVKTLKEQYGIYLVDNGRINVAAMTPDNMDYLCASIAAVLKR